MDNLIQLKIKQGNFLEAKALSKSVHSKTMDGAIGLITMDDKNICAYAFVCFQILQSKKSFYHGRASSFMYVGFHVLYGAYALGLCHAKAGNLLDPDHIGFKELILFTVGTPYNNTISKTEALTVANAILEKDPTNSFALRALDDIKKITTKPEINQFLDETPLATASLQEAFSWRILHGHLPEAIALAKQLDFETMKKILLDLILVEESICPYSFCWFLLFEKETAQYHALADDVIRAALPGEIYGQQEAALFHARRAAELEPANIAYKELVLSFFNLPLAQKMSSEEATRLAHEILAIDPTNQRALTVLSGINNQVPAPLEPKDLLRKYVLEGNFEQAQPIAKSLGIKTLTETLCLIGFDDKNICAYSFITFLINQHETAHYHAIAHELMFLTFPHIEGSFGTALHHIKRAEQLYPESFIFKESILATLDSPSAPKSQSVFTDEEILRIANVIYYPRYPNSLVLDAINRITNNNSKK